MTAASMNNMHRPYYEQPYDHDGRRERWDIERDNLQQHSITQTKIVEGNWKISDSIKDNRHSADLQYADLTRQNEVNTAKVIAEQKDSERRLADKIEANERRRLELENQKLYTENSQLRFHERKGPRVYDYEYACHAAG